MAAAPTIARRVRDRRLGWGSGAWLLLATVMSLAWLAHPSVRGVHTVFELWGAGALAATLAEAVADGLGGLIAGAVGAVAVLESVMATLQLIMGANLGLTRLGEDRDPFYVFAHGVRSPMGSMVHIYVLAGLALIGAAVLAWRAITADRPALWSLGAAIAVAPVGFTFSRAGLLGFAALVVLLAVGAGCSRRRRATSLRFLLAATALCIGAGVPATIWHDGWSARTSQTAAASTAAALTTDRGRLVHESLQQISDHSLTGVGPGRYVPALKARFHVETDRNVGILKPVHNVPLLVTAEGGVAAGLVIVALLIGLGWRALRSGPIALALFSALIPYLLLDHFAYSFPQGLVITAIWLGFLDSLVAGPRSWRPQIATEASAAAAEHALQ